PHPAGDAVGGGAPDARRDPAPLPAGGHRPRARGAGRDPRGDAAPPDRRGERLMARHREDDTTGAGATPAGAPVIRDDDPTSDLPDPLGLGGTPPPDAPSRRPKPRFLALLGEFFRMSRTTAILLGAFVLAGALYLLVRDEPVVAFGPPAPPPTSAPAVPDEPTSAPTESVTETTEPPPTSA